MKLFRRKRTDDGEALPRRRREAAYAARHERRAARVTAEEAADTPSQTFRRGRTLTGSYASSVSSVNEHTAELKSSRVHAHDLKRQRRHLGGYLLLVFAAAGLLYLAMAELIATASVRANVSSTIAQESYVRSVDDYLAIHPVERFAFGLNEAKLTEYVQQQHPEVESLKISDKQGFGRIEFYATMRKPLAGWVIDNAQQYVDRDGVVFARNYFEAPTVNIIDRSGIETTGGKVIASNRFLGFVGKVIGGLAHFGLSATEVTIPYATTRQIDVRLDGVPYYFKLSVDRPAGEQAEDASRVVKYVAAHPELNIEYADIRIEGKAFYRDK